MIGSAMVWTVPALLLVCGLAMVAAAAITSISKNWGFGLCMIASGYILMMFQAPGLSPLKPLLEDFLILIGVGLCCRAYGDHFNSRPSKAFEFLVCACSLLYAATAIIVFDSVRLESFSIIIGSGLLVASSVWRTQDHTGLSAIVLKTTFLFVLAVLACQAIAYTFVDEAHLAGTPWAETIWGNLIQYTAIFGGVIVTLGVLIASNLEATARNGSINQAPIDRERTITSVALKETESFSGRQMLETSAEETLSEIEPALTLFSQNENGFVPKSFENLAESDAVVVRDALSKILGSETFSGSPRLKLFLSYIAEESIANRAGQLKEYSIAVDVFDKKTSQDLTGDSAVRSAANRLRQKLDQFYLNDGRNESIRIVIPRGGYIPFFLSSVRTLAQEEDSVS